MPEVTHVLCVTPLTCTHCKNGRVPGGKYKDQGEVVTCAVCRGKTEETIKIPFDVFCELVKDQIDLSFHSNDSSS